MKVKALAPWFGGKRTLAPEVVIELGKHTQYFEPFCGSMAVLLAKQPSQKETVNDLHGDLINLARVVQDPDAAEKLYDRLQRAFLSEDWLREAREFLDDESSLSLVLHHKGATYPQSIERAYWYFVASWMGRNGTSGTSRVDYQLAVRWTRSGGSPTVRWRNAVDSLPAWHRRLQNVCILSRDAFRVIDRFEDHEGTAIYVDPPYIIDGQSRTGVKSSRDNSHTYKHEFSNAKDGRSLFDGDGDDHDRLRDELQKYNRARIVVSYYDCDRVRDLYRGWTFVEHTRVKHLGNVHGRGNGSTRASPEVLIVNGPSYGGNNE